jgi:cell division protease FtsH
LKQPVRLLVASIVIALSCTALPPHRATATATMEYGEFIAQVKADKINQVSLSSDRTKAVVTQAGQSVEVILSADQGLVETLTKNNVDITIQPPTDHPWWRLTQSLGVPLLWVIAPLSLLVILLISRNFIRG